MPIITISRGSYSRGKEVAEKVAAIRHRARNSAIGLVQAMRFGFDILVIPHIADQFYWGHKAHELGVGPQPIPRAKLVTEGLAAPLDQLVRNEKLRAAAFILGEQIRSENGVENAVQLIEETFA